MGVINPKGPNPFETNTGSARYTELSNLKNNFIVAGLPGDAEVIFGGRGHDVTIKPVVGDIAILGSRKGIVTAVSKTGLVYNNVTFKYVNYRGVLTTLQVVLRTTVNVPANAVLSGNVGYACSLGTVLFLRTRTNDFNTWPQVAQIAEERKVAPVRMTSISKSVTEPNGDTPETALSISLFNVSLSLLTGYSGSIIWQKSTNGIAFTNIIDEADQVYAVSSPIVGANYYRAQITNGFRTKNSNVILIYFV